MLVQTFLQLRSDRLIAMGRTAIASFALFAIWIDPSQPTNLPELTYGLLGGYLAFAVAVLLVSRRERVWSNEIAVATHLVDLTLFSTLMFVTEGPTSPFFFLFTFSLVAATFRWQWKGALWTAIAVLILLVVIAAAYGGFLPDVQFDIDRFVMRCAHVIVIGGMLVYFGFRYQRTAEEATRLAAWHPDPGASDTLALLNSALAHVAHVFAASRVLLVLEDEDEPLARVAVWEGGSLRWDRLVTGRLATLMPEELAEAGFIRSSAGDVLFASQPGRLALWQGPPVTNALAAYGLDRVLSVPVQAERATGRLFVAGGDDFSREDLTLAWLMAAQIAAGLDRMGMIKAMQHSAAVEERLHLARDLHDGILQTLAGTALQLETIKQLASRDPDAARERIDCLQAWLSQEQRDMRGSIGELRLAPAASDGPKTRSGLVELAAKLEQQWAVAIKLTGSLDGEFAPDLDFHARQIVREAVANAVRHGKATAVSVDARAADDRLALTIVDNGGGLAKHGRFDAHQCAENRIGPRSLRERIVGLGGSLVVESTPSGVTLSIALPLRLVQYGR